MATHNPLRRAEFGRNGLVVVRGLIGSEAIREVIGTTVDVNYFTGPHQAPNSQLFLANLKRGGPIDGMALGEALEAVNEIGDELGVDLRHETVKVRGQRQERPARVQSIEIPELTVTPYGINGDHVAAVVNLAGDLSISGDGRTFAEVLQPGDAAFVHASIHRVATFGGSKALLIAGSQQPAQAVA